MTVEEMKRRKKELCFTNEMIAERSGVPLGTVQKIFAGFTGTPRFKTMAALEKVLGGEERPEEKPARNSSASDKRTARYQDAYEESGSRIGRIGEEALSYGADPKQGSYMVDDYYALSEDRRVELIDGWIYDMATPVLAHQAILGQLHLQMQIQPRLRQSPHRCRASPAGHQCQPLSRYCHPCKKPPSGVLRRLPADRCSLRHRIVH